MNELFERFSNITRVDLCEVCKRDGRNTMATHYNLILGDICADHYESHIEDRTEAEYEGEPLDESSDY